MYLKINRLLKFGFIAGPVVWLGLSLFLARPTLVQGDLPLSTAYLVTDQAPWRATHVAPVKNAIPDVINQILPWKIFTVRELKSGKIPLWNPYQFSGTPHLANVQSAVLSPLNILFLKLPFPAAWSILVLLQPILAGLLMFLFLESLGFSRLAALAGSLAFGIGGFMTTWLAYATIGYAWLVLPLALMAGEKLFNRFSYFWFWVLTGSITFSLLSGHTQTSLYLILALGAYFLIRAGRQLKKIVLIGGAVGLGIALASPQTFPALELYLNSDRSRQFQPETFRQSLVPPLYLLTVLAPDYFGNPVTRNDYFGRYAEWQAFAGTIIFGLALFGVFSQDRRQKPFLVFLVLALVLGVRTFLPTFLVFAKIPVLGTGNGNRSLILLPLALAGLAAVGIDRLRLHWPKSLKELTPAGLILGLLFLAWFVPLLPGVYPGDQPTRIIAWRNLILPTFLTFSLIGAVLLGRIGKLRPWLLVGLFGLIVFDLGRYQLKWSPFGPAEWFYPPHSLTSYFQKLESTYPWHFLGTFGQAVSTPFGFKALDGYDPVNIAGYNRFVAGLEDGSARNSNPAGNSFPKAGLYTRPALDLLGVNYLVYSQGETDDRSSWVFPVWRYPGQFTLIWEDSHYQVWENLKVMPRAVLFAKIRPTGDLAALFSGETYRGELMIDHQGQPDFPDPGWVEIESFNEQPGEVNLKIPPQAAGFLLINNPYFPGWRAEVDGRVQEIFRANQVFQAVPVDHNRKVKLIYQPLSFRIGLAVAGLALVLGIGFTLTAKHYLN